MRTVISTEKHWNKAEREAAPAEHWALPEKKELRIDDAVHTKLAWSQVDHTKGLTDDDKKKARKRIMARAKELDMDTSGWKKFKAVSKEGYLDDSVMATGNDCTSHLVTGAMTNAAALVGALSQYKQQGLTASLEAHQEVAKKFADLRICLELLNEELVDLGLPEVMVSQESFDQSMLDCKANLQQGYDNNDFYFLEASPPDDDESTEDEG
ncbi:MAG TPA: DUF6582 domain-containing protein [Dongiaceae bacterium]|nr:DUF6582 domain-containing protein [Dongiaceae bacterium]